MNKITKDSDSKCIPVPSKRRLVLLERLLSCYTGKTITSQKIEQLTPWSAAVIRRDISLLNVNCGASNGYKTEELKLALRNLLGILDKQKKCCIVGLTRMGQVLLDNTELDESPFRIVAGFDSNVNRTEVLRSSFPLHPTTMLEQVVKEEQIEYAILTTGADEAQKAAEQLARCGIKRIVNYTPCILSTGKDVQVENVSLLTALETLSI